MKYLLVFLIFLASDCGGSEGIEQQDVDKKALDDLKKELIALADESICSEKYICDFVGFGSKPCGGFWEYLVYSNSIDIKEFLAKVTSYNKLEKEYNEKWNIASDCMFVMPPNSTDCIDGKCTAVFN